MHEYEINRIPPPPFMSCLYETIIKSFDDSLQTMRGSIPWMAPEMVKQTGHGRSADIWSVGATMIEMYTARYPWPPFSNNIAAMYHVATATEVSPTELSEAKQDLWSSYSRSARRLVRDVSVGRGCGSKAEKYFPCSNLLRINSCQNFRILLLRSGLPFMLENEL